LINQWKKYLYFYSVTNKDNVISFLRANLHVSKSVTSLRVLNFVRSFGLTFSSISFSNYSADSLLVSNLNTDSLIVGSKLKTLDKLG